MFKTILKCIPIRLTKTSVRHMFGVESSASKVTLIALPNGVRVATEVRSTSLACVTLSVAAGPRYETSYTNGLTHFIEHLALKGCRTMDKDRLEKEIQDMGATLSVRTSREEQVFSVVMQAEDAYKATDILCRTITELEITDAKIKQERENINRELADSDIDPKKVLFEYLHATAFQGTPLGQRVIGSSENLDRFNADMASTFLCENYVPYRLCLATTGAVDPRRLIDAASGTLGCIPSVPVGELGPTRYTGSQVVFRDDSLPFCHVAIAFEAPGYNCADYYKMMVLSYILGAWDRSQGREEGQAAPVARCVAINKLCECYQPFYKVYRDVGLWGVYFIADKWKLDEVVTRIQEQWMEMCTVLRDSDVERALRIARRNAERQYNSVVWSAHDLGQKVLHTSAVRTVLTVNTSLAGLTAKDLRVLADRYLYDRCPVVAAVGPSETMPDYVRIRSGTWWLRL